jgi:hypothetical protein
MPLELTPPPAIAKDNSQLFCAVQHILTIEVLGAMRLI